MLIFTFTGIREVQIIQWFVEPEARVEQFQKIVEVQSDKASVEVGEHIQEENGIRAETSGRRLRLCMMELSRSCTTTQRTWLKWARYETSVERDIDPILIIGSLFTIWTLNKTSPLKMKHSSHREVKKIGRPPNHKQRQLPTNPQSRRRPKKNPKNPKHPQ